MTAISFRSESGDDYLELLVNIEGKIELKKAIKDLSEDYGDEWSFFTIIKVKSYSLDENLVESEINKSINKAKDLYYEKEM